MGFTAINNAFAPIATAASAQEASTATASNGSAARSIASQYLGRGAEQPEEAAPAPGKKGSAKTKSKKRAAPSSETSKSEKRRTSSLKDSLNITKPADEQDSVPQIAKSKASSASKSAKPKKKTPSKKQVPANDPVRHGKDEVAPTATKSVSVFAPATSMDSLDSTSAPTSFDSVKANAGKSFTLYQGVTSSSSHSTNIDFSQPWLNSASADRSTGSKSKYSAQSSKSDTNTVGSDETASTKVPAKEAAKLKRKQAQAKSNENEVMPPSAQAEATDKLETSKDPANDVRRSKRLAGSAQSTSKALLPQIPDIEDFSDVDDEDLMNFAKSVEKDIEERPSTPSKRARKDNVRDVDENEDYGGALLSQAEKKMIKEMKSKREGMIKPILRKPFLPAVLDRSPIFGASKGTLLRTCFRVGEALNTGCQAVRCGINVVIELYARVTASWREPKPSRKQHFVFKDLYHDNPPHLQGTFELWDQAPLWDLDSKALLTATDDHGMICRMIGKVRRDESKWKIEILNLACLAFQFGCGWVRSKTQLLILRFLAGFGGASAISIGAAIIGDLFEPEDRSAPQALYSMAFACGPALGPIAGGFIAEYSTWRWCFWASSALGLLVVILGLFLLHETYLPILQARNKPKRHSRQLGQTPTKRFQWQPLARPFQMLCIEPTVMLLALYVGFITGIFYLVITVLAAVYTSPEFYHQSLSMSGLHYIALTIGFLAGSTFNAPAAKKVYLYLAKTRYPNAPPRPEYRVPNLLIGSLLVPAGMFLFAWSAQYHLHWSIPDLGIVIFCTGYIINMQCMMLYLIDTYTLYAASAIAATTVLRSLMGFGLPLAAPKMLQALGLGWTISLLGFVAVGLGIPAPFVFWRYGEGLRRRSRFARSS